MVNIRFLIVIDRLFVSTERKGVDRIETCTLVYIIYKENKNPSFEILRKKHIFKGLLIHTEALKKYTHTKIQTFSQPQIWV